MQCMVLLVCLNRKVRTIAAPLDFGLVGRLFVVQLVAKEIRNSNVKASSMYPATNPNTAIMLPVRVPFFAYAMCPNTTAGSPSPMSAQNSEMVA